MKNHVQRLFVSFICCSLFFSVAPPVTAAPVPPPVIITEIQTGEGFVEVYNRSDLIVDLSGWQIRLASGSNASGMLATVGGGVTLAPGSHFVLDVALTNTDKTVALFAPNLLTCELEVQDALAWSSSQTTVTYGEGRPITIPGTVTNEAKLLQRYVDAVGGYIDTDDNSYDFALSVATPGITNPNTPPPAVAAGSPSPLQPVPMADCGLPPDDPAQLSPELTELLPNPGAPLSDVNDEFIEIHNPNEANLDLSGYILETGLTTKHRYTFPMGTVLAPGTHQAFYSGQTHLTLSNSSGQARLIDPAGVVVSESAAYATAADNQAWAFIDDLWSWVGTPTPGVANPAGEPPREEPDDETPIPDPSDNNGLTGPDLSELLPNPATPQTDAADEFIELFNPNDVAFDLSGYILESGVTTKRRYVFPAGTALPPQTHTAFFVPDTGLALSNSGGQVRLLDPSGVLVAESDPYGTAKDGQAWVFENGTWQWTTSPTPNAPNAINLPAAAVKKTAAVKTAKPKKKSAAKSTAKPKKMTSKKDEPQVLAATTDTPGGPIHPGVLALVGGFALLYGAYEYRHDMANRIRNFRTNRSARAAARQGLKGR